MRSLLRSSALLLAGLLAACGATPIEAGTPLDGGFGNFDGGPGLDGGRGDAGPPIQATDGRWSYVHFPEAHCGNGSETGIGINPKAGATTLVLYFQGGGACWEAGACYVLRTAVHVEDTVQEATVLTESTQAGLKVLFDRDDAANPLRGASFVYVPYCTGDLHHGTHIQHYEALGQTRDLHHVGALNTAAYLRRLVPTFPNVQRVIVAGVSAGGYGALLHAARVQAAFGPQVRVDVLDDSGIPLSMEWQRFGTAMQAWKPEWPSGCTECSTRGYGALAPFLAGALPSPSRQAFLFFRKDGVIASYFGLPGTDIQAGIGQLVGSAATNQHFLLRDGDSHVLLGAPDTATSTGVVPRAWLRSFVEGGDANWAPNAGP